jgi:branched-chain amino acid transport system substrate-binding protein
MKMRGLIGVGVAAVMVAAACQAAPAPGTPAPGTPAPGTPAPGPAEPPTDPLGVVAIPAGEQIHIAFWGVISGPDGALGTDQVRGVEVAIADKGEIHGRTVRLSQQDGLCTPEGGATAATALAADATLVGLIGSVCSDETAGGIATITNAGLTTISGSNTRPAFTVAETRGPEMDGYLRTAHSDAVQGDVAANFAYGEQGWTTAATIHDGSAYAEALVGVFEDVFRELGGTITVSEAVDRGQTDMRPVLTRIAADSPDVIFFPLFTAEAGFVTAQAADVPGLENVALMGADAGFSAEMVQAAGPNAVGKYLSSPDFGAFGGAYQDDFLPKYRDAYGEPIQVFHAHAYDAAMILMNAIEQVAVEVDGTLHVPKGALRDAIFATSNHQGLTGTLNCDENGDCSSPIIAIYQLSQENVDDPVNNWPPSVVWSPGN